jgi:hypothetical protein
MKLVAYTALRTVHLEPFGKVTKGDTIFFDVNQNMVCRGPDGRGSARATGDDILQKVIERRWFRRISPEPQVAKAVGIYPDEALDASAQRVVSALYAKPELAKAVYALMYKTIGSVDEP